MIPQHSDGGEDNLVGQVMYFALFFFFGPKMLFLREPASHVLVSATMVYCVLQGSFPLILGVDGINDPI